MKTKLTIRELAPYLPYGLKVQKDHVLYNVAYLSTKRIAFIDPKGFGEVKKVTWENASGLVKPILRPLSDLTKEIEHNGENFVPEYWIDDKLGRSIDDVITDNRFVLELPYFVMQKLIEWHFNVFNLPEHLYIDKSTLNELEKYIKKKT